MKNRSLNFKVGAIILVLITGSVVIAVTGLTKMHHMDEIIAEMVNETVARAVLAKDIRTLIDSQAIDQRNVLLAETAEEIQSLQGKITERHEVILKEINAYLTLTAKPAEDTMQQVQKEYIAWYEGDHKVLALAQQGAQKEALEMSRNVTLPLRLEMTRQLEDIVKAQDLLLHQEKLEADKDYQDAKKTILLISVITVLLSLLLAVAILRALHKVIQAVISDLNGGSDQVTEASQQIAEASVQLSQASTEQAASLEETVAAVEELTSVVKANAEHSKHASQLAEEARNIASQGDTKINNLKSSMSEIADNSKKIEDIIGVIESIAFQTNLLALNASVEAARAGEGGKGFAVVAESVRTLAQRTSAASKDISTLIKTSVEKISIGESQAKESSEVLEKVLDAIKKVSELNIDMANANEEQANGISQISQAMNQLDQATQINAATSEETSASAEELSAQAIQMRNVVKLLNHAINGKKISERSIPKEGWAAAPTSLVRPGLGRTDLKFASNK